VCKGADVMGLAVLFLAANLSAGDVSVELTNLGGRGEWVSFGLPAPSGLWEDLTRAQVFVEGSTRPLPRSVVRPILLEGTTGSGGRQIRSWLIQAPRASLGGAKRLRVEWGSGGNVPFTPLKSYSAVRFESPEVVGVVDYTIERSGNEYRLAHSRPRPKVLFLGWEPMTIAVPPAGYLAATGLFGELMPADGLALARLEGMSFLSENMTRFGLGALHDEGYYPSGYAGKPGDPASAAVVDLTLAYEAWLYDRCATYLIGYAHSGEVRFYRHALRACSFYASQIDSRGFFTLKTDAGGQVTDPKYSHVRGLYLYYALTGDESALEAGRRIARMWLNEPSFVLPYRQGHARGPDKLWTERLLAHALESLVYGYKLTGEAELLAGARELFETAWKHLTASDAEAIRAITGHAFPPQPCLVHASGQHEGWPPAEPFCSPWMSALLVDPLLRYQEITGDSRVDEVFVRFGRYLRDTGSTYFYGNPIGDTFLRPARCYKPAAPSQPVRTLIPVYGAGRRADGSRYVQGNWDDFDHCADATALSAAALRALRRTGGFDRPGPQPFETEGDSFFALHHEFAHCALVTFRYFSRPNRDPRNWTSAQLVKGFGDPAFVVNNKIGFASHYPAPLRKLSWWFNGSLLQFRLLEEAGLGIDGLRPGAIQPTGCQ